MPKKNTVKSNRKASDEFNEQDWKMLEGKEFDELEKEVLMDEILRHFGSVEAYKEVVKKHKIVLKSTKALRVKKRKKK